MTVKRICVYTSIIITVILMNSSLSAQENKLKQIHFKGGDVVQGHVIEMNTNIIKIMTASGKIVIRPADDVIFLESISGKDVKTNIANIERQDRVLGLWKKHSWGLQPELSFIEYEEPDVMQEKGFMYGIGGSYAYHNNIMLRMEGRYSYGQVDYKNSGTIDNIDDHMIECRGLMGYDFSLSYVIIITPYAGFGYRYLNDDASGMMSSTGAYGYERESNYFYSPIGIETNFLLIHDWSFGITFEFDIFWKGKQKSHLGQVAGYDDIENDQDDGYGVRGSAKLQKRNGTVDFIIEPFFRYWNIEESEATQDSMGRWWVEPKNNSTEVGIIFTVRF
ncbi:MAG: autotransporter outer membrane beta-barrel domain-containing protein [Deltaproteobacteria bacterium]|nr:autotransporter outer membrane beta-barrel domain-containing protein [Deltaproteobacteria bacterium]